MPLADPGAVAGLPESALGPAALAGGTRGAGARGRTLAGWLGAGRHAGLVLDGVLTVGTPHRS